LSDLEEEQATLSVFGMAEEIVRKGDIPVALVTGIFFWAPGWLALGEKPVTGLMLLKKSSELMT